MILYKPHVASVMQHAKGNLILQKGPQMRCRRERAQANVAMRNNAHHCLHVFAVSGTSVHDRSSGGIARAAETVVVTEDAA